MIPHKQYLSISCVCLLLSGWTWGALVAHGTCKDVASDSDVIFRATALETHGAATEMQVIEVIKGRISRGKITFKHAVYPPGQDMDVAGHYYYVLKKDRVYLIHAKKTSQKNVFSQLWGTTY